jgi:hypothetical protein
MQRRPSRKLRAWLALPGTLAVLSALLLGPIDQQPYAEAPYFRQNRQALEAFEWPDAVLGADTAQLAAGWGQASLLPDRATPMAGYRLREAFEGVRDTLLIQALVLRQGGRQALLLSADLLIFPPALYDRLLQALPPLGWVAGELYVSATHTHSAIGGWAPGAAGHFMAGPYDEALVDWLCAQALQAVARAEAAVRPVTARYGTQPVPGFVRNRIAAEGKVDAQFRCLYLEGGGKTAVLGAYSAHPTCLDRHDTRLSADFPGVFRQGLAERGAWAMYVAGAVGSHGPTDPSGLLRADSLAEAIGEALAEAAWAGKEASRPIAGKAFGTAQWPLALSPLQLRLGDGWGSRPWAFEWLVHDRPVQVSALRLGNLLWVGLPCDFSGELALPLYEQAERQGQHLAITSFNGEYVGYLTPSAYYHTVRRHELRDMSWAGPYAGDMLQACLGDMLRKAADR